MLKQLLINIGCTFISCFNSNFTLVYAWFVFQFLSGGAGYFRKVQMSGMDDVVITHKHKHIKQKKKASAKWRAVLDELYDGSNIHACCPLDGDSESAWLGCILHHRFYLLHITVCSLACFCPTVQSCPCGDFSALQ